MADSLTTLLIAGGAVLLLLFGSWSLSRASAESNEAVRAQEEKLRAGQEHEIVRLTEAARQARADCEGEIGRLTVRVGFLEGQVEDRQTEFVTLYLLAQEIRACAVAWGTTAGQDLKQLPVIPPLAKKGTKPLNPITVRLRREQLQALAAVLGAAPNAGEKAWRDQLLGDLPPVIAGQVPRADAPALDLMNIVSNVYRAGDLHLVTLLHTADSLLDGMKDQQDALNAWWDRTFNGR